MDIKVFEHNGDFTVKTIDDIDEVKKMTITMIHGDEVLTIAYNDGTVEVVVPGMLDMMDQFMDYADYVYTIYDANESENLIDNSLFINRNDSYWWSDICNDPCNDLYGDIPFVWYHMK